MTVFSLLASAAGPLPPQHLPNWGDNPLGTWFIIFFFATPFIVVVIAGIYIHFQNKHTDQAPPENRREAIKARYLAILEQQKLLDTERDGLENEFRGLQPEGPFRTIQLKDEVEAEQFRAQTEQAERKRTAT